MPQDVVGAFCLCLPLKRNLVLVYWLLLLVSTLSIGGLAFYLLQGESNRLRKLASDQARQTGHVIVESLKNKVAETKTNAMLALGQLPDGKDLERQLGMWSHNANPYTRMVFLYDPANGLVMPKRPTTDFTTLESLLHDEKGWVWGEPDYSPMRVANANHSGFSPNGIPVQVTPTNNSLNNSGNNSSAQNGANFVVITTPANISANSVGLALAFQQTPDGTRLELPAAVKGVQTQNTTITTVTGIPSASITIQFQNQGMVVNQVLTPEDSQVIELARPKQGWQAVGPPEDRRWLGWMRTIFAGPVRGMVLDWAGVALRKSLADSFPSHLDFASGFVLLDPAGTSVISQYPNPNPGADAVSSSSKVSDPGPGSTFMQLDKLPVGAEMPGWNLVVYFNPAANFSSGYIAVSTVMVTILIIAVLVGGTLLLREARREAFEAARKTSFVSNVSHELKTPLTTIRMYAELLGEGRVRDENKQRNYLSTIIGESQRLTRLVNNVLDFSRLERGRKQYHPTDVALPPIIDAVLNAQKPRLDEAGFSVGSSFPAGPLVRIHADRDALEQVLLNLIDNAMKYAATGRWIGIRLSTDSHFAYLAVSDHGPGVPPDHQERIFDTFHRVDDSITANQPGAGLGLSIARRLLRDQEGDLIYRDNQPNGSTFVAKLPLASALSAAKIG